MSIKTRAKFRLFPRPGPWRRRFARSPENLSHPGAHLLIAAAALAAPSRQPGRRQRVQSIVAATLLRAIDWRGGGAGASGSDESLGDDEIGLPVSGADPA